MTNAFEEPAATDNAELAWLYTEDQADREQGPNANIDWSAVSKRDGERRERIRQIVAQGGANTSTDYYNAAMIYQHGSEIPYYDEANRLALKAVELDPTNKEVRWLAATAKDRSLMWQERGTLVIFDGRTEAPPLPSRCSIEEIGYADRNFAVLRL